MVDCDLLTVDVDLTSLLCVQSISIDVDGPCLIDTVPEFFGVIRSRLRGGTLAVLSISSDFVVTHFEISISEVVLNGVKALEGGLISIL